jgi:hypothetical protein
MKKEEAFLTHLHPARLKVPESPGCWVADAGGCSVRVNLTPMAEILFLGGGEEIHKGYFGKG